MCHTITKFFNFQLHEAVRICIPHIFSHVDFISNSGSLIQLCFYTNILASTQRRHIYRTSFYKKYEVYLTWFFTILNSKVKLVFVWEYFETNILHKWMNWNLFNNQIFLNDACIYVIDWKVFLFQPEHYSAFIHWLGR